MYQLGLLEILFSSSEKQRNMFFQGNALHSMSMLPSISPPDTSFSVLQEVPMRGLPRFLKIHGDTITGS